MLTILALTTIPAVLAAEFESAGLAVVAVAGVLWSMAAYACSNAPFVPDRSGTALNDRLAGVLSAVATVVALIGIVATIV